ncbi:MAG TPA: hypothetical protein VFT22_10230 [Kofleriaceae bacterium]|nr:hypothetical protein [Kofleriaceae bacterium]
MSTSTVRAAAEQDAEPPVELELGNQHGAIGFDSQWREARALAYWPRRVRPRRTLVCTVKVVAEQLAKLLAEIFGDARFAVAARLDEHTDAAASYLACEAALGPRAARPRPAPTAPQLEPLDHRPRVRELRSR